jgi:hypothetical protein
VADGVTVTGDVHKGTVKLGKDGLARFQVHLGLAGGEKCAVEIGTTSACDDHAKYFETWRQLHFQISHPKGAAKPDPADFVTSYKEIKVQMEEEAAGEIKDGGGPKGSWVDGAGIESGMNRKVLVIGPQNQTDFHKLSFKNKNDGRYAHFLMCDFQYDVRSSTTQEFELEDTHLVGGGPDAAIEIRTFEADAKSVALPTSIKDGKDAVRKLTYSTRKHSGKIDTYTLNYVDNRAEGGKLTFTLPDKALQDHQNGDTVTIKLEVHLAKGPYNGSSTKNLLLIAMRNSSGARPAAGMNQTMVHEIGHALGMCAKDELKIPGIADNKAEHGMSYTTARGHTGTHCAKGIDPADYGDVNVKLTDKPGTCVMYGEAGDARTRSFCDLCQKLLLPAALREYLLEKL